MQIIMLKREKDINNLLYFSDDKKRYIQRVYYVKIVKIKSGCFDI